ncbi:protein DEK isoform X1 [Astyanax mexicanus]|uniref:Protein DEK isoform X1 n=2 Tax=Astyanax mexicanus TaxID=7994 RepID=A0A8B9H736_ASTMX|nr:protein DEK isoform X1 [Astyanax mexicanus]XP_007228933.1 protein DEK isoform X1 [Astyanax mexicanus]XP_049336466.1 protein DEK isoform X1 [Astyanax mexicanus]KAG9276143.1 protein DEK isoform X1 [Astyanax mexicanus]
MEEDMDIQDDHTKEEEEEDESEKPKSKSIYEVEIMEGKREKKTVQRLDMQVPKPKEKLKIESIGKGDKLGDIPRINHAIGRLKAPMLKPLHKIIYDRPGAVASLRKHLRLFNGFPFEFESDPYNKKRIKMSKIPKVQLKSICQILDIERSGSQAVLADRIMQFLVNPTNSGKPVSLKKKRKKKTAKDTKRENKTASKSKKQQMDPGKSKEIVTSSSDEDDDEDDDEDEGDTKNKDTEKSSASDSRKQKGDESDSDEEEESVESDDGLGDSEDEEKTKSKKSGNKKKPTPKITEDNSDLSASDEDEDNESAEEVAPKKTKKKPSTPKKKPAPKTKKADSSSNRKRKESSKSKAKVESSDEDDQPLIKLIKKPPTNEQLQDKIKDLLKTVNLEEVTMKQICQQVYDLYPDFDLTDRKDVIKDTVKGLIS